MSILTNNKNKTYLSISILGKSFKLDIKYRDNPIAEINKKDNKIELFLPKKYKNINNTYIVNLAIEKMYDEIAEEVTENAMEEIRIMMGFAPEDYNIKRMNDSFCKCMKGKVIVINPDIVRYNKKIIYTTLIQAFCKIKYKEGSVQYKEELINAIEKYESNSYKIVEFNKGLKKVS